MNFKFICPCCKQVQVNCIKKSVDGINYFVCPICDKAYSLDAILVLNRTTNEYFGKIPVESQMYEPTKKDKDGQEYDMQPRSRR